MTSAKGNTSDLPPAGELAAAIRDGATAEQLATTHGVAHETLARRISNSGYSAITGLPVRTDRPVLSAAETDTGSLTYVGGGDWDRGLPTDKPARYRSRPAATGLNWDAIRDNYLANGGIESPEVFTPNTVTKIHARSGLPTTYQQAGEEVAKRRVISNQTKAQIARRYLAGEAPSRLKKEYGVSDRTISRAVHDAGGEMRRRGNRSGRSVGSSPAPTHAQKVEIAARYSAGESSPELQRAYGYSHTTIRKAIVAQGGTVRSAAEAAELARSKRGAA